MKSPRSTYATVYRGFEATCQKYAAQLSALGIKAKTCGTLKPGVYEIRVSPRSEEERARLLIWTPPPIPTKQERRDAQWTR